MDVELEAAVDSPGDMGAGVPINPPIDPQTGAPVKLEGVVYGAITALLMGGIGWIFQRRTRSSNALEDTVNDTNAGLVVDLRARNAQLEKQSADLFEQLRSSTTDLIKAEALAQRAQNEVDNVNRAATMAAESVLRISNDMAQMRVVLARREGYIVRLKETLAANNIPIPPEPETP
ncbi:hypothetical protein XccvBFoX4_gp40 [Xanthomonas phage FoX4]|uniref:Uncharacterized protein n=1 Tax=Xanthomonas phage FoX4 TaxID=2723900 RepID=A0A858WHQ0_9CAUD|nr:hypothetical protein KNU97_gp40 [Xanthomonas phage FoX4]QJI52994.1 hypothetical protein XccvBFoX4_gp40 [Xanthomonas phage FoX4]